YGWTTFLHPDDRDAYIELFNNALVGRATFETLVRVRHQDGTYRWFKSVAAPRFRQDEQFLGLVGSNFDIQELIEAQEALQAADTSKDNFLAMLAHELRNPMAPLRNLSEIIGSPNVEKRTIDWAREILDRQVGKMARLVDDLLDVARMSQGKISIR